MIVSLRIVPVLIFWMRPFSVWISMMFLIIPTEFCIISKKFFLAWTKLGLFLKIPTLYYFFGFIRAYLSGTIWLSSPSSFQRTISADSELHLRITGISFLSDQSSVFLSESLSLIYLGNSYSSYSTLSNFWKRYLPSSIFWQEQGMILNMPFTRYLFLSDGLTFSRAQMALSGQMGSSRGLVSSLRKRKASKNQKSQMRSKMDLWSKFSCILQGSNSMSPLSVCLYRTFRRQRQAKEMSARKVMIVRVSKMVNANTARERRLNILRWFYVIVIKQMRRNILKAIVRRREHRQQQDNRISQVNIVHKLNH